MFSLVCHILLLFFKGLWLFFTSLWLFVTEIYIFTSSLNYVVTFFDLNLHFYVFFSLVCDFLSPKLTFFDLLYYVVTFFYLNLHFLIRFFFFWKFNLNISGLVKYDPMKASSYLPLPKELKAKRRCLNIKNNNKKCFLWSIFASLHPVQRRNHSDRVAKY